MNLNNISKFCDFCIHKTFDPKAGIICGKTKQKPDFEENCPKFEESEESARARKYIAENPVDPGRDSVKYKGGVDSNKEFVIGGLMIALGIVLTLISQSDAIQSGKGSYSIFIGLIVLGFMRIIFSGKS